MYDAALADRYVQGLVNEIKAWREVEPARTVDTIYFGGGTPSLLSPHQLELILSALQRRFTIEAGTEVTLEINPGSVTKETLLEFRGLGINRASFGAQTFDDDELARLGRCHNADDTRRTFRNLRQSGFENVSFDLIAGLPGQTMSGWQRNLDEAFALRPEHLSFYLLEVHQGTPLAAHIKNGIQPAPDEELAGEMYTAMLERAGVAGYEHYEISNLCLAGFASRHNSKYWTGAPYYSFGCSAHSYDGGYRRWANERDPLRYLEMIEGTNAPIVSETVLTESDRQAEAVFLGLRMMGGLSFTEYHQTFGADLRATHEKDLMRFHEAGLIECGNDHLKLTRTGALLSNEVFEAFI